MTAPAPQNDPLKAAKPSFWSAILTQMSGLYRRLSAFLASPTGKILRILLNLAFLAAVLALILTQIFAIGWQELWAARPQSPWFYVLGLPIFFALPLADLVVYGRIWDRPLWISAPVFVRKRIYSQALVGYAGEAYLGAWAHKKLHLSLKDAAIGVKDGNILASTAGNVATGLLLVWLFLSGELSAAEGRSPGISAQFTLAAMFVGALIFGVFGLRKQILRIRGSDLRFCLSVHAVRVGVVLALQALQYASAAPQIGLNFWVLTLAAQMVVSRIPFLPNRDLAGAGIALALTGAAPAGQEAVAAAFLASGALAQALNLGLFAVTSWGDFAPKSGAETMMRVGNTGRFPQKDVSDGV